MLNVPPATACRTGVCVVRLRRGHTNANAVPVAHIHAYLAVADTTARTHSGHTAYTYRYSQTNALC